MTMKVLYGAGPEDTKTFDTGRLRAEFLLEDLFQPDAVSFTYTHVDRLILGGAVPVTKQLVFGTGDDIGTPYLLSAREMGVANLGGSGTITVDGQSFTLENRDVLYNWAWRKRNFAIKRVRRCTCPILHEFCSRRQRYPASPDPQIRIQIARTWCRTTIQQAQAAHVYSPGSRPVLPAFDGYYRSCRWQCLEYHATPPA
ncbi:hypothetical protein QFZ34_000230 [Phyllobacterium ifriqiyense]|uniref:5-dehydro-4-deoxy-D-glucuronate isomerase n=1 Tax=Phyllobacterium ifriqiyense TaxID=314238 RepID=A0ABU0S2V7_9HYPH|nr:hypothetical protein [Phyllobacterium ifriqiyense]